MRVIPYTYKQAKEWSNFYEYLKGRQFNPLQPEQGAIECVAVAPAEGNARKRFMLFYLLSGNAEMALAEEYRGLLFDVIVIARSPNDPNMLVHEEINTWLAKNDMANESYYREAVSQ